MSQTCGSRAVNHHVICICLNIQRRNSKVTTIRLFTNIFKYRMYTKKNGQHFLDIFWLFGCAHIILWALIWYSFQKRGVLGAQKFNFLQKYASAHRPRLYALLHPTAYAMFWNWCDTNFHSFGIFSFWDMFDFVFKIPSELERRGEEASYGASLL